MDLLDFLRDWIQRGICWLGPTYESWLSQVPKEFRGGGASAVVTRGHTGRRSGTSLEARLAQEWGEARRSWRRRLHLGTCHFWRRLQETPRVKGSVLTCFRGRLHDGHVSGEDMGPPPRKATPEGRYNTPGRPVHYLSMSREGALIETHRGDPRPTCVQEYQIRPSELHIADFASDAAPEFMHSVFDLTESARVEGRTGPDDYALGHLVASLCVSAGLDGMLVCGILGSVAGFHYRNLVLFRPGRSWRRWTVGADGFETVNTK